MVDEDWATGHYGPGRLSQVDSESQHTNNLTAEVVSSSSTGPGMSGKQSCKNFTKISHSHHGCHGSLKQTTIMMIKMIHEATLSSIGALLESWSRSERFRNDGSHQECCNLKQAIIKNHKATLFRQQQQSGKHYCTGNRIKTGALLESRCRGQRSFTETWIKIGPYHLPGQS
jgi:hypothetical protein